MPNAHWEIAFAKDAENYCTKGDIIIDTDDRQQGKRSDIDEVLTLIQEGRTNEEIAQTHPKLIFKFAKNIQSLRLALQPRIKLWKQIKVIIYVGGPGTGKSRKVFEQSNNLYNVMEPINGSIWFDNYSGQEDILLDDFYGWIKYHTLLQLLDGYPMQLPIKGSTVWKNWSRVFITSNKDPSEWYNRSEWDALRRRITTIEHI